MFDISSNMPASTLRQLTLSLSSSLSSKYTIGQGAEEDIVGTSRVSIYTYNSKSQLVGDINRYTNAAEVATALLGLKVSNDSSAAGLSE